MVFKRKFFLDLTGDDTEKQKPVEVAPVKAAPQQSLPPEPAVPPQGAPAPEAAASPETVPAEAAMAAASASDVVPEAEGMVLTTAEAIAAELAAAQANRPAPSKATFAPECVAAGGALPRRRRLAGANLGTFKEMAKGMMRS